MHTELIWFRELLDEFEKNNFSKEDNKLITIENLEDYKLFLKSIQFKTKYGPTVLLTNGNGWYINTLIKNLIVSMTKNETFKVKMGVVCSDQTGFENREVDNCFLVKIPLLQVDNLVSIKKQEDYYRLVFIKTVMIYHALLFGYTVIYIDPDMSFQKPSLEHIINTIEEHGLTLAGRKEGNVNTNIMGVTPSETNIKLFEVEYNRFEANLRCDCTKSDEEFIITKDEYSNDKVHFVDFGMFPSGTFVHPDCNMLHANCIQGLDNKINFLKMNKGWYL